MKIKFNTKSLSIKYTYLFKNVFEKLRLKYCTRRSFLNGTFNLLLILHSNKSLSPANWEEIGAKYLR